MDVKSKSHLALMEQAIMILVFAFAAALCVQAFQKADVMSKNLANRDRAVILSQTVAETVKAMAGDLESAAEELNGYTEENKLILWYGPDWNLVTAEEAVYELCLVCTGSTELLEKSELRVTEIKTKKELFYLPVSWQREAHHE